MKIDEIVIREIESFTDFDACLDLQREVFGFPESEVSPRRYLTVAKQTGGFTLGAFDGETLIGFIITVPAFRGAERIFYSHMAGVLSAYQAHGIGAKIKWAQRRRALEDGVKFIKWTFHPAQARNAFFNIEKLGAVIRHYVPNFYGSGFSNSGISTNLESDRIYAEWELESEKVVALSKGEKYFEKSEPVETIEIPADWNALLSSNLNFAEKEQTRLKIEFQKAFSKNLVCRGFDRNKISPKYLFYQN